MKYYKNTTFQPSIDIRILKSPEKTFVNGKKAIVYELILENYASEVFNIQRIDIIGTEDKKIYFTIENKNLEDRIFYPNRKNGFENNEFYPGTFLFVFIELEFNNFIDSNSFYHRLEISVPNQDNQSFFNIEGGILLFENLNTRSLGPPYQRWTMGSCL